MDNAGIFYGRLEHFKVIWYILWPFGNVVVIWYIFPRLGILCQEKSGNPALGALYVLASNSVLANVKKMVTSDCRNDKMDDFTYITFFVAKPSQNQLSHSRNSDSERCCILPANPNAHLPDFFTFLCIVCWKDKLRHGPKKYFLKNYRTFTRLKLCTYEHSCKEILQWDFWREGRMLKLVRVSEIWKQSHLTFKSTSSAFNEAYLAASQKNWLNFDKEN
jgi:hypothetical protein